MTTASVRPSMTALSRLRTLGSPDVAIVDGFWAHRQRLNRDLSLIHI